MPRVSKTFRVFVSSTFSDLKAERNALQERVFPKLRTLCMQRGCRFQAIDLRWGVSEEASVDQQAMPICIEELRRCQDVTPRPNFIVLLGQRYGWLPIPPYIPADEFENISRHITAKDEKELIDEWYKLDENAVPQEYVLKPREGEYKKYKEWEKIEEDIHRILLNAARKAGIKGDDLVKYERSATEQEINEGALKAGTDFAFCYFREIGNLPEDKRAKDFRDFGDDNKPDQTAKKRLEDLKRRLKKHFPEDQVYDYDAEWSEDGVTDDHLDALCERVEANLWEAILEEIESMDQKTDLEQEIDSHSDFCENRARHFIGRETIIKKILDYVQRGDNHPLVVYGPSGSGKSALMARCVQLVEDENPDAVLIHRFIGATAASTDIRSLLESLCNQIYQVFDFEQEKQRLLAAIGTGEGTEEKRREIEEEYSIPSDMQKLPKTFKNFMTKIPAKKNLLLILDALDQLSPSNNAHSLNWLPNELPENVRIVVSVLDREGAAGECLRKAKVKLPQESLIELKPLTVKQGEKLLDTWFKEVKRTLQDEQRVDVVEKFKQCKLPLYLKLAFEEARRWHSYDGLPCGADDVPGLNADIEGVILDLLSRLEKPVNHGDVMVSRALGYLAAARYGLTEDEILEVLPQDETVFHNFFERAFNIPAGIYDTIIGLLTDEEKEILGDENPEQVLLDNLSDDRELCDDILKRSQGEKIALRFPVVIWSRLYHDLEPYFTERAADGTSLMSFYHRQFGEVIAAKYASGDEKAPMHKKLAGYFGTQPHEFDIEDGGTTPNLRKMSELPFQQTYGEQWEALEETLTDLVFIEAKCTAGMTYDLVTDYGRLGTGRVQSDPLRCTAWLHKNQYGLFCPQCLAWHKIEETQLGQVFKCPECARILRISPSTIEAEWRPRAAPCEVTRKIMEHAAPVSSFVHEFADFIRTQAHILNKYPALTFQQAANRPDDSAPGRFAKERLDLKTEQRPWLRWVNKHEYYPPNIIPLQGVSEFSWFPDGSRLMAVYDDGTLAVLDPGSGEKLLSLAGHQDEVRGHSISFDGRRLASYSNSEFKLWNSTTGEELTAVSIDIQKSIWSPDGSQIALTSNDNALTILSAEDGGVLANRLGHSHEANIEQWEEFAAKSGDLGQRGKRIAKDPEDMTLRIYDVETGEELGCMLAPRIDYSLAPDGRWLTFSQQGPSSSQPMKIWDGESGKVPASMPRHYERVVDCIFSPDSRRIVSRSENDVKLWDGERGKELAVYADQSEKIKSVGYSPDGRCILIATVEESLNLRDAVTGDRLATLTGHTGQVPIFVYSTVGKRAFVYSPNGKNVASHSHRDELRVWDAGTGEEQATTTEHGAMINAYAYSPDCTAIVSASDDWSLIIWDADNGEELARLLGHLSRVYDCAFSPDGSRVVSASRDNTLRVWDTESGKELLTLAGHTSQVWACSYSPDGHSIASASQDTTVKLWDAKSGEEFHSLSGHTDQVRDCCFSPDGQLVYSVADDNSFRVWDAKQGVELMTFFAEGSDRLASAAFAPSGREVALGTSIGLLQIVDFKNLTVSPSIITVWRQPDCPPKWQFWRNVNKGSLAFGCIYCRKWSEVSESSLGTELACPVCGERIKLNSFTIDADWCPIAKAWAGKLRQGDDSKSPAMRRKQAARRKRARKRIAERPWYVTYPYGDNTIMISCIYCGVGVWGKTGDVPSEKCSRCGKE